VLPVRKFVKTNRIKKELENFIIYLSMVDIIVRLSLSLNKTPKPFWSFNFYLKKPYIPLITSNKDITSAEEFTDEVICSCYQVKASTIKMAILSGETKSIEEISQLTHAGTACRACICRIERICHGFPSQCGECAVCPATKSEANIWEYA
jgi:bacterioferritin-associated ferredoxin